MKRLLPPLFAGLLLAPSSAAPVILQGTVGSAPVLLMLDREDTLVDGWYVYLKMGHKLGLKGRLTADAIVLDESDFLTFRQTGHFEGRMANGVWSGTWSGGGKRLPFRLSPAAAPPDGRYRCTVRRTDRRFEYDNDYALAVTVARGALGGFDVSRTVTGHGDSQQCSLSASDLKPAAAREGLLLRARGTAEAAAHCSVRLIGAGDYLYLAIGDGAEDSNDCRGTDEAMFCSPRAFWADLILDRRTQSCMPVD